MNSFFSTLVIIISFSYYFFAQVGINTATPNAKSVLDLISTNKGFLPPRMREAQRKVFFFMSKFLKIV
jgi:hypothetical protein